MTDQERRELATEWLVAKTNEDIPGVSGEISEDDVYELIRTVEERVPRWAQEITAERQRQNEKWGEQRHPPLLWLSILGEEYGEACAAANEAHFDGYARSGDWSDYRKELIQVAAVAVAALESLDAAPPPKEDSDG